MSDIKYLELKNADVVNMKLDLATGTTINPYLAVAQTSDDFEVDLCAGGTSAPARPFGIVVPNPNPTQDDLYLIRKGTNVKGFWNEGDWISICVNGECLCQVGTAGATAGNLAMVEASTGKLVNWSSGGNVVGYFLETATKGNLARIWVNPHMPDADLTDYMTKALATTQTLTADGAITIPTQMRKVCILNKGTAIAATLADPAAGDEGKEITIISKTAAAHTVTFTTGLLGLGTSGDVATFGGAILDSITVRAHGSIWEPIAVNNVTIG